MSTYHNCVLKCLFLLETNCHSLFLICREETEIIEGEVVEIQIDRPATGTVGLPARSKAKSRYPVLQKIMRITETDMLLFRVLKWES